MMMDPFPPIAKAFTLVTQQERQFHSPLLSDAACELKSSSASNTSSQAHFVSSNSSNRGGRRGGYNNRGRGGGRGQSGNSFCTHCEKTNHTSDTCYILHGFPPGYQTKINRNGNSTDIASNNGITEAANNSVSGHKMVKSSLHRINTRISWICFNSRSNRLSLHLTLLTQLFLCPMAIPPTLSLQIH
jgi:hypothetical protein